MTGQLVSHFQCRFNWAVTLLVQGLTQELLAPQDIYPIAQPYLVMYQPLLYLLLGLEKREAKGQRTREATEGSLAHLSILLHISYSSLHFLYCSVQEN